MQEKKKNHASPLENNIELKKREFNPVKTGLKLQKMQKHTGILNKDSTR